MIQNNTHLQKATIQVSNISGPPAQRYARSCQPLHCDSIKETTLNHLHFICHNTLLAHCFMKWQGMSPPMISKTNICVVKMS